MKYLISYKHIDSSGIRTLNTFEFESDTPVDKSDDIVIQLARRHSSNMFTSGLASILIESVTLMQ